MKWIALIIMKMILTKAKNDMNDKEDTIVKKAFGEMIKSYKDTIMFLQADRK